MQCPCDVTTNLLFYPTTVRTLPRATSPTFCTPSPGRWRQRPTSRAWSTIRSHRSSTTPTSPTPSQATTQVTTRPTIKPLQLLQTSSRAHFTPSLTSCLFQGATTENRLTCGGTSFTYSCLCTVYVNKFRFFYIIFLLFI